MNERLSYLAEAIGKPVAQNSNNKWTPEEDSLLRDLIAAKLRRSTFRGHYARSRFEDFDEAGKTRAQKVMDRSIAEAVRDVADYVQEKMVGAFDIVPGSPSEDRNRA